MICNLIQLSLKPKLLGWLETNMSKGIKCNG